MEVSNIDFLSGIEFEHLCEKLIQKMGFETEITKASGDGGIDIIAYNHQPLLSGKYIIQCKRYAGSVGEPIIRDLYGVVTSERANKGILVTTGMFTNSAKKFANGKPIELIDGEKLRQLLISNGLEIQLEDCAIQSSDNLIEQENYSLYNVLAEEHPNELLYQLTFLEVAVSRLYREILSGNSGVLSTIINDFYNVFNKINISDIQNTNKRLFFSLLFLSTPILLCERKFEELINRYYQLLEWDELINTINLSRDLEVTYFTIVNNLVQVLIMVGKIEEAKEVRKSHIGIITNQIDYFNAQIDDDDDEITQRFEKLKCSTISEDIGYIYFCDYDLFSTKVVETGEKLCESHYSHIYKDCVETSKNICYEIFVLFEEIYIIQDNNNYYFETFSDAIMMI